MKYNCFSTWIFSLLIILLTGAPIAYSDLDSASTSLGSKYKAKCGEELDKCEIHFEDDLLVINQTDTLKREQFTSVVIDRTCRQRSILLPFLRSCYSSQYDRDVTITYIGEKDKKKSALIVFRPGYFLQGDEAYSNFYRELQIWLEDVIRPVGASIKIIDNS